MSMTRQSSDNIRTERLFLGSEWEFIVSVEVVWKATEKYHHQEFHRTEKYKTTYKNYFNNWNCLVKRIWKKLKEK